MFTILSCVLSRLLTLFGNTFKVEKRPRFLTIDITSNLCSLLLVYYSKIDLEFVDARKFDPKFKKTLVPRRMRCPNFYFNIQVPNETKTQQYGVYMPPKISK